MARKPYPSLGKSIEKVIAENDTKLRHIFQRSEYYQESLNNYIDKSIRKNYEKRLRTFKTIS